MVSGTVSGAVSGAVGGTVSGAAGAATLRRLHSPVVTVLTVAVVVDYADRAALGAVAPELKDDLGLDVAQLGYLGAAFGLVGGLSTLVAGALVDRCPRLRLLALSALAWSVAMVATGSAETLTWLLVSRGALAVVLATVGPAYPSLVGDAVPPAERGAALGLISSGQLVGGAIGVGLGALCVSVLTWRWTFWLLALPGLGLAVWLLRTPEPARRGSPADQQVSWGEVTRRLWATPTAVWTLLAGSVGSYYLASASAFSTLFAVVHYDVSTAVANLALLALGVGAVLGITVGSRTSDRLSREGRESFRLVRAGQAYVLTAVLWLPALLVTSLAQALPFLVLGSAALAATLPTLDAIRIDVVPAGLRGRTEAVRTLVRAVAEGGAPLVFGLVARSIGDDDRGLQVAFLTALPALAAAGGVLVLARRSYDADRARLLASDED